MEIWDAHWREELKKIMIIPEKPLDNLQP
jgi:hypothetical protein